MKKQFTAVEQLDILLLGVISFDSEELRSKYKEALNLAKALEKKQMDKVSEDWFVEGCSHMKENKRIYQSFEQYYNETYEK